MDVKETLSLFNYPREKLETMNMVLDLASDLSKEIAKHAKSWDEEEAQFHNGHVVLPKGMQEMFSKVSEAGLTGLYVPEEFGGADLPFTVYAGVVEILSRACPSLGVAFAVHGTAIDFIRELGTQKAKEKYLPKLASGQWWGAITFSEPESGSDLGSLKSYSEKKGNKYHLNGSKIFVTNGGIAHVYTTLVLTDKDKGKKGGMGCFIVEKTSPGFNVVRIEEKMGLKASPTAQLSYDNCEIPEENLMGENGKGFAHTLSMLCGSRTCIGAQATGIAQAAYEKALKYSKERRQFNVPIASFQAVQFKLADMAMKLDASRRMYLTAAYLKDAKSPHFPIASSEAKLFASESALRICEDAIQIHGGYGYIKEYDVERHYRDARVTTIYEGTSEVHRLIISKAVIDAAKN